MKKTSTIYWSVKEIAEMIDNGELNPHISLQRGFVWGLKEMSYLISSVLENYHINPIIVNKRDNEYRVIDGKQRCLTLNKFILGGKDGKGGFKISGLKHIEFETKEGIEYIDINGKRFCDLSEEMQDKLRTSVMSIAVYDNITDEKEKEVFIRSNKGKQLSSIELLRVQAKSDKEIEALGHHELFETVLLSKAFVKYVNESLVQKAWGTLYIPDVSFNQSFFRPILENTEFTPDQVEELDNVFTRILNVYNTIKNLNVSKEDKIKNKKILSVIMKPSHFSSICVMAKKSIDNNISIADFTAWILYFFTSDQGTSISKEYNIVVNASSNASAIRTRVQLMEQNYNENIGKYHLDNEQITL